MDIGISSSCFYPQYTEASFRTLAELGVKTTEIFFNTKSELFGKVFDELMAIKEHYGIDIVSMHPFASFAEGYFLFGEYERLFRDTLEDYKKIFEAEAKFGAKYHIMHGCKTEKKLTAEFYAERYLLIYDAARENGMTVLHENVVNFHCGNPYFMKQVSDFVGDRFQITLDIKQARRANVDYHKFIELLGKKIMHLHLSDFDDRHDCLIPSEKGKFDFAKLFAEMNAIGYNGAGLIEVYSKSFKSPSELAEGKAYLDKQLKKSYT